MRIIADPVLVLVPVPIPVPVLVPVSQHRPYRRHGRRYRPAQSAPAARRRRGAPSAPAAATRPHPRDTDSVAPRPAQSARASPGSAPPALRFAARIRRFWLHRGARLLHTHPAILQLFKPRIELAQRALL